MRHHYSISTSRLRLRQIEQEDLERVRQWRNLDSIRRFFLRDSIIECEQQRVWYKGYLEKDTDIMFVIEETMEMNEPIGTAALYNIDFLERNAEFGRLMIGDANARGRGMGQECVKAVCDFGFKELGLLKIYLEVFKDNVNAVRIYEKVGFKLLEVYRHHDERELLHMELINDL